MVLAHWNSIAICAVAKLGVADHLESGPKTTKELASLMNVQEDPLYRVMRAVAGVGVFHEGENRTFSQTDRSDVLRTNAVPTLRYAASMCIDDWQLRSMQAICSTIENGRAAQENVFGMGLFPYLQSHPDQAFRFNRGMTDLSSGDTPALLAVYDFSAFEHIVDIAGGAGGMLAGILEKFPHLRGTLFDQPSVIEQAKKDGILNAYATRCDLVGGSFFEAVPSNADAYIMKHIIHDWDDDRSLTILRNIHRVLAGVSNGRVILLESVVQPGNVPDFGKLIDMEMLLIPGGRERTADEFAALFARAGFELTRIVPTASPLSVIEAVAR